MRKLFFGALFLNVFCWAALAQETPIQPDVAAKLQNELTTYFAATPEMRAAQKFAPASEKLLLENENAVRQMAWRAYQNSQSNSEARRDYEAHQVRFDKYLSAYTLKAVGSRPFNGWPLIIAMHGGGGAPKEVNDSQWKIMQIYYKDHPELGGYLYLALRAPNDTWNGFYDDYVYPLIDNLIRQFLLFGDVDGKKVFLIGYSHGGYGAFNIGPKMPDHFAAIHASAAAPTDNETSAKTLRNTPFSVMVGEEDNAYERRARDEKFAELIQQLKGERTDIYPVTVQVMKGFQHSNLQDRDKIPDLYPHLRNAAPRELTWEQTDSVIHDFYWLHCDAPGKKQEISATCRDNKITIKTTPNVPDSKVLLDSRLIDFSRPVSFEVNGKTTSQTLKPSLRILCDTLVQRGDIDLTFTAQWNAPTELLKAAF